MKIGLLVCLLLWLPSSILAQEKPAAAEARKVVDYFYQGKGQGAVLMAHKLCAQIYEEGSLKYECQEEITGGQIQKDREVFLWMNFLVPAGDQPDIIIHFKRNNKVRGASNLELPGAVRYRTPPPPNLLPRATHFKSLNADSQALNPTGRQNALRPLARQNQGCQIGRASCRERA